MFSYIQSNVLCISLFALCFDCCGICIVLLWKYVLYELRLWTLGYSDKYFLGLLCYLQYYVILDKKTTSLKLYMNAWNLLKLLISNLFHLGTMQCRKETRNIYKADTITNPYTKMNCFKLQTHYDSANFIQENISELIFI